MRGDGSYSAIDKLLWARLDLLNPGSIVVAAAGSEFTDNYLMRMRI